MGKKAYIDCTTEEIGERVAEALDVRYNTDLCWKVFEALLVVICVGIGLYLAHIADVRIIYLALGIVFIGAGAAHLRHNTRVGRFCIKSTVSILWGAFSDVWVCLNFSDWDRINQLMHIFFLFFGVALIVLNYADAWLRKLRCDMEGFIGRLTNESTGGSEQTLLVGDDKISLFNTKYVPVGRFETFEVFINSDNVSEVYCDKMFHSAKMAGWIFGGGWCFMVFVYLLAVKFV